jgi:TRAP-type C4-dicarboxylate transport system substrate-binding protein
MKNKLLKITMGMCLVVILSTVTFMPAFAEKPAPSKVIELSFAHTIPPVVPIAKVYQQWAQMISEKSEGRVKINFYWSESLLKASELYRGVQTGVADMSYYVVGLDYGLMPLNMFTKLGFMGYPSMEAGTEIYHKIWNKFPEIRDEFKGVKVMAPCMSPGYHLSFPNKEVHVPADVKGMKIISSGAGLAAELAAMGAAPMDVKVGDMYMSLERGLAEGICAHFPVLHAFGILPVVKYHTMFGNGAVHSIDMVNMNLNTWNSLPPDIQKIFEDMSSWLAQEEIKGNEGYIAMVIGKAKEMGHTFITPTPAEMKLWREAAQPVHDKWIADTEAKGLPAKAVYKEATRLIKQYTK